MSNASSYQSKNFKISYFERLNLGGGHLGDLDIAVQNWRHGISAFGGFDTAAFDLVESQNVMDDWVSNGLGRPIVAYDDALTSMWEGFVNAITVNQAGLSVTIGPLTDIANKVFAIYSGVDTSVYPPEIGVRKQTPVFTNLISQSVWGVWPEILSLAGVTDANADQLVSMYLQEHGNPEVNSQFSFGQKSTSLTLDCVGWYRSLVYPYNFTAASSTVGISTRIQQILAAQVNSWISTDYSQITSNTTAVQNYENDNQLALELIRGYTAMGDGSNNRHLFGIYEDRKAVYGRASTQIDYEIKLSDNNQGIFDPGGALVPPWRVRPGKWVFFSDFMPGLGAPYANLHEDPRMLQIESVQFDVRTPFSIQLAGGHTSKYEQRSARLGLRGMDS